MTIREFFTRWGFDVDFGPLEEMERSQKALQANFAKIAAVGTAALAAVAVPAASLEDELRRSAAAAGKTGDEFDEVLVKLTGQAQNFAEEIGLAGTAVAGGFFDVISAGVDPLTKGFDQFAETGLRLAKVTGGDVGVSIEQLNTSLKAFGLTTEDSLEVADRFVKANTLGATSVGQLSSAMRIAGPIMAQTLGQSLDTTVGVLTAFADAGFKAERGGEALKQVALAVSAPTTRAAKVFKDLNIQTTNADGSFRNLIDIIDQIDGATSKLTESSRAQALEMIFGRETVGKFSALLGVGADRLREFETGVSQSDGSLALALDQMEGLTEAGRKLLQSIKNVAITFGSPLLRPLTRVVKFISEMIQSFRRLLNQNPEVVDALSKVGGTIGSIITIGAGIGAIVATFNLLLITVKKLGAALLITQLKAIAVPAALFALGAGLFLLFEDLTQAILGQENVIGDFIDGMDTGLAILLATVTALGVAFAAVNAPIVTLLGLITGVTTAIIRNKEAVEDLIDSFSRVKIPAFLQRFSDFAVSGVSGFSEFGGLGLTPNTAVLPSAASSVNNTTRSVEVNVGGISVISPDAESAGQAVRQEIEQLTRTTADNLLSE